MNMVLTAPGRSGIALPEFKIARKEEILGDFVLPSLEVAGPGMHWVEVSRAVAAEGRSSPPTPGPWRRRMSSTTRAARTRCWLPRRPHGGLEGFHDRGFHLGHVTGHSIGMTMIEFPESERASTRHSPKNMVLSMHPHAIAANGEDCLYMQDTWLVTTDGGVRSPTCVGRRPAS